MLHPQAADRAARGLRPAAPQNGISGFPSPRESDCDAFIAGHGSAALSTAIGIARAKSSRTSRARSWSSLATVRLPAAWSTRA
ncbi:hypothetical protein NIA69_15160 [Gemmiger formicilis]|nr:hypothetical protein [Gemmiger formicilis]